MSGCGKTTDNDDIPDLMCVQAAAGHLRCSPRHVYQLIQGGLLSAYRLGKRRGLRVTRKSVVEYVARNRVDPEDYFT